jgi:hypothetical protein
MDRIVRIGFTLVLIVGIAIGVRSQPAHAAANPWPHTAVNGFSTTNGDGYWLVNGDGSVTAVGNAALHGDASGSALSRPVVGGSVAPSGTGYWLVAVDGGIFSYGGAHFYGSMGAARLNQPVFAMAPTRSGNGYWLVARDGGVFTFGDGGFYGSTGGITLNQPIEGIASSPTGRGYRLVAHDGGIFSFGDAPFYGSLPGVGVNVTDVVGAASTPTNKGYWIAEADGAVHAFGDAHNFGNYTPSSCGEVTAIFSNPKTQGYRLILRSGATVPVGTAPGGNATSGTPPACLTAPLSLPPTMSSYSYISAPGDFVGAGESRTFVPGPGIRFDIGGGASPEGLSFSVIQFVNGTPVHDWGGNFVPPYGQTLHVGTYAGTTRFHGPTNAGLDINGDGGGCNNSYGTFTINYLTYETKYPGHVAKFDVTFVQHCESPRAPPLYGHIRFRRAGD